MQVAGPSSPDLREILRDDPRFHRLVDIHPELSDELTSWGASMEVLLAVQALIKPGMCTLETGCGRSTVMFAAAGTDHWCITPARAEIERVASFCVERGLSVEKVHFIVGPSQEELPRLDPDLHVHVAFIDGGHFFPVPCFDWYYADKHLLPGGLLVLDDIRIPTVRMVFDFLRAEDNWKLVRLIGDTAFFRKLRHSENLHDWLEQGYNRTYPDWSFLPLRIRLKRAGAQALDRLFSRVRYHLGRLRAGRA